MVVPSRRRMVSASALALKARTNRAAMIDVVNFLNDIKTLPWATTDESELTDVYQTGHALASRRVDVLQANDVARARRGCLQSAPCGRFSHCARTVSGARPAAQGS